MAARVWQGQRSEPVGLWRSLGGEFANGVVRLSVVVGALGFESSVADVEVECFVALDPIRRRVSR